MLLLNIFVYKDISVVILGDRDRCIDIRGAK